MIRQKRYFIVAVFVVVMLALFNVLMGNLGFKKTLLSNEGNNGGSIEGQALSFAVKQGEQEAYIVLAANLKDPAVERTTQTLSYLQQSYRVYDSLSQVSLASLRHAQGMIVTTEDWESLFSYQEMSSYLKNGGKVIFEYLPAPFYLKENGYYPLLGIDSLASKRTQKSVRFYNNLLLCDSIYRDINLSAYDAQLTVSCKIYAQEFLYNEEDGDTWPEWEEILTFNPLLWRNYWNGGQVQVMNGNFMDDLYGIGILSGIIGEMEEISLTPIVNANLLSFAQFPVYGSFNSDYFQQEYYRDSQKTLQDVVWPTILSFSLKNEIPVTAFWSASAEEPPGDGGNEQNPRFWLQEFSKNQCELGLGYSAKDSGNWEKTQDMYREIETAYPEYQPKTFLVETGREERLFTNLSQSFQVMMLAFEKKSMENFQLTYTPSGTLVLPVLSDGSKRTDREQLMIDSLASGLGYLNSQVDLSAFYEGTSWQDFSKMFTQQIGGDITRFPWINRLTASDAAAQAARFLRSPVTIEQTKNEITATCEETGRYFLLRAEFDISQIEGGTAEMIQEGVYLITMNQQKLHIVLKGV